MDVFLYFNPLTLKWERKHYLPKREIHDLNEHDLSIMNAIENKCKGWLKQEHLE